MVTVINGMRVMTRYTIEITPLQKNDKPVSRPIDTREGQHTADLRLFFCSTFYINPSHELLVFLQNYSKLGDISKLATLGLRSKIPVFFAASAPKNVVLVLEPCSENFAMSESLTI